MSTEYPPASVLRANSVQGGRSEAPRAWTPMRKDGFLFIVVSLRGGPPGARRWPQWAAALDALAFERYTAAYINAHRSGPRLPVGSDARSTRSRLVDDRRIDESG